MDAARIRGWLLCQPRPAKLRILGEDGQTHELEVKGGESWARIAESVEALRPELVEALSDAGKLIRAIRPSEQEEEETEEDEVQGIPVNAADPESMRLITFAKLLAEAHRFATETAFRTLAELFNTTTARAAHLEQSSASLQKTVMQLAVERAAAEAAAGGGSFEQTLVEAFMSGKANGVAKKPPQGGESS